MARAPRNPAAPPKADRPLFAKGYAIHAGTKGVVAWKDVVARLERSKNYWIATTRPDGRPHVMPVWGVWLNGAVCFGTDRNSRKARNLLANPAATLNLESGDDVVIIEGTVREITDAKEIARIDVLYAKKYKMKLTDAPGVPFIVAIEPRVVFAWHERNFPESATRWRF
jgi:nitroimidazol reductase NimA-like FMN-containing flavoprotein (pyridoxamine 5'-phosphate oxidase superfamily)